MITTDKFTCDHFTIFQYNDTWEHKWRLLIVDDYINRVVSDIGFDKRFSPDEVKDYLIKYVEEKRKEFI